MYDEQTKKPLEKVQINDFLNKKNAETDAESYFELNHEGRISVGLIFEKQGCIMDSRNN